MVVLRWSRANVLTQRYHINVGPSWIRDTETNMFDACTSRRFPTTEHPTYSRWAITAIVVSFRFSRPSQKDRSFFIALLPWRESRLRSHPASLFPVNRIGDRPRNAMECTVKHIFAEPSVPPVIGELFWWRLRETVSLYGRVVRTTRFLKPNAGRTSCSVWEKSGYPHDTRPYG